MRKPVTPRPPRTWTQTPKHPAAAVRIEPVWKGETVVCIGGGPSLTPEDVDYCRGRARVIAINDAHRLAPWADLLYACDWAWWKRYAGVMSFQGPKYGMTLPRNDWNVLSLKNDGPRGLSTNPTGLRTGSNSGYQAINLAFLLGASRIVLLGYDLSRDGKGRSHWFGEHPKGMKRNSRYDSWLPLFKQLAAELEKRGIQVVNCSRRTALKAFPCRPLEEVLPAAGWELGPAPLEEATV